VLSLVSSVWQEIGWVECLTEISYFCVEWDVKPELGQTYLLLQKVECLRAGVELTRRLLTQRAQAVNASSQTVQHTAYSLQVK